MALSLPQDQTGAWIPSKGICVSFTCKAHARAAVSAMAKIRAATAATGETGGKGVGLPELVVLKGVPNDSLELEIKFQGGAMFDPEAWSSVS